VDAWEDDAEGAAGFTLEVFALTIVLAMELITILNHCHHHRGFVYRHARFAADKKSIAVDVRPREGSAAVGSGCHQPAPGYDHLPERGFEFILCGVFWFSCCTVCDVSTAEIVASWSRRFPGAMASTS
jgi:hypothetical protein